MTDEEKQAIENSIEKKYREVINFYKRLTKEECFYILNDKNKYSSEVKNFALLNLINLIEKKDKIIDEMAKWLYEEDNLFGFGILKEINTPEKIKEYFKKKVGTEEK